MMYVPVIANIKIWIVAESYSEVLDESVKRMEC